jgi:hypothetical protein
VTVAMLLVLVHSVFVLMMKEDVRNAGELCRRRLVISRISIITSRSSLASLAQKIESSRGVHFATNILELNQNFQNILKIILNILADKEELTIKHW